MRCIVLALLMTLTACSDRIDAPLVPDAAEIGFLETVFVATNREELDSGVFGIGRTPDLKLLQFAVSVPENRIAGEISDGRDKPKPGRDFVLTSRDTFESTNDFQSRLRKEMAREGSRDVTVYVHGFNNSFADAAFRMAQLSHDLDIQGPVVSFSWPSRGNPLGYQYDLDSVFYSRDSLASTLKAVMDAGANSIVLVAHSMGSALALETLRQLEITSPGWATRSLGGVLLISPDVNIDVFRSQTSVFDRWPEPFVIFSSKRDILLRISGSLRGDSRQLGVLDDLDEIDDLPVVVFDVSDFQDGDAAGHFTAATSPSFLRLISVASRVDSTFLQGHVKWTDSILGSRRVQGKAVSLKLTLGDE